MENLMIFEQIIKECTKNNKIDFDDIKKYKLKEELFNDLLDYLNKKGIELYVENEQESKEDDLDAYSDDSTKQYLNEISKFNVLSKDEEIALFKLYQQGNINARKQLIESNLRLVVSIAKRRYLKKHENSIQMLDLCQAGAEGVMTAMEKFDINKGYKFSTYATWWIDQKITRYMYENDRTIRIPSCAKEKVNKVKHFQHKFMEKNNRMPYIKEYMEYLNMSEEQVKIYTNAAMDIYSLDAPVTEDFDVSLKDTIADDKSVEKVIVDRETFRVVLERLKSILTDRELNIILYRNGFFNDRVYTLEEVGKKYNVTRERIRQIEAKTYRKARGILREHNPKNFK